MRKKTKNRHGGIGLQVLVAVLMLLLGGVTAHTLKATASSMMEAAIPSSQA